MAHRNLLTAFFSVEGVPGNFYGDPRIWDLGLWLAYGQPGARFTPPSEKSIRPPNP